MPGNVPHRGSSVSHYLDNLLPDSDRIRTRLRSRFGAESTGAFGLLSASGRDCVGAIQLLPPDVEPEGWDRIDAEPLSEEQAEHAINAMLAGGRALDMMKPKRFAFSRGRSAEDRVSAP
jgi:serine/threonine-protein kinase HipA